MWMCAINRIMCTIIRVQKFFGSAAPNESEMEVILHATVVSIEDDSMEIVINEDGAEDNMIYTVSIENCEFHIDRDILTQDYPYSQFQQNLSMQQILYWKP